MAPGKVEQRPWGRFVVLHKDRSMWLKRLIIAPGAALSLQSHSYREEYWLTYDEGVKFWRGNAYYHLRDCPPEFLFQPGHDQNLGEYDLRPGLVEVCGSYYLHRLINTSDKTVVVNEWAYSTNPEKFPISEDDITRYVDDYGRGRT